MEDEDFLAAVEADNDGAPVEEATEQPQPEEVEAQPEPAPEQPPEPEQPVEPEAKPEPHAVPISALLDERDKRKQLEAELAEVRSKQQQAQQVEASPPPDPYEDPEGFAKYQSAEVESKILNHTLNMSERFAVKEHGKDTVEAAKTWAQQRFASDPFYQQQVLSDADPYERVVSDYRRDQIVSKVSDPSEFEAFLAWKAAQSQITQQAATPAATPTSPAIPPRSLASAPSAGSILTEPEPTDEEIFADTFARK